MEVRIENLTKAFIGKKGNKTVAVDNMSFVVPDGKLVGLLGPSGCGKSTTLYMIAGLHKPTDGKIYFGDEDVTNVPPENRGIGLVFQNYALYPHFSVKQNIIFPLDNVKFPGPLNNNKLRINQAKVEIKKVQKEIKKARKIGADINALNNKLKAANEELDNANKAYDKAKKLLDELKTSDPIKYAEVSKRKLSKKEKDIIAHKMAKLVDIENYLDRKPKELSGGQQQRVAIARALAKTPRVLLLDEPLSNLDARLRLQTREEIRRIQKETGITTIFVTHDQEEAMSISDIIVVMKFGVIQQIDEPQKVYDEPVNLFVAKFLGSPAINVFDGEIKDGKLYLDGKIFDDDACYKKEYINAINHERIYVKGTKISIDEYKTNNPNIDEKKIETETIIEKEEICLKDRTVKIGVRPEAFIMNGPYKIPVNVEAVQRIGRDVSVIGQVHGQKNGIKIIVPSENYNDVGDKDYLEFAAKRFYVFEETGERIK